MELWRPFVAEADVQKALELGDVDREQRQLGVVDAITVFDVGGTDQLAVQRVGPPVVRADEPLHHPGRLLTDPVPAVPADIEEGPKFAGVGNGHHHALAQDLLHQVRARCIELAAVADEQPLPTEDPVVLAFEDRWVQVLVSG